MRRPALFTSLHGYRRAWVSPDLAGGLTLLVIAVPEQLATSRLAGMPPITGFYAFVAGTALFALLGSNPQMSVGADSTIAPLFAAGVAALAVTGSAHYVALVGILAVMVGIAVALVGLLRLGWIAEFLSLPIITGFLSGVAVIIVAHQLPDLLGLPPTTGSNQHRVAYVAHHLGEVNGWSLLIGLGVLAIMIGCARIGHRIPGALIGLVASTALVAAFDLQAHGVAVLGTVHTGAPHFGLTGLSWSAIGSLAPLAAVVALVVVTQTAATTQAFAERGGYDVDAGRDFVGVGAGSVMAGLAGAFPVNASPPRTGAYATSGGRTQAGALGAAAAVLLLVPVANIFRDVPLTTLAAILMFVAYHLFNWRDLAAIFRFSLFEFALAAVTLLAVVLIGIQQGIAVAVALAILDRIRISARPKLHVMGRIPGTTSWQRRTLDASAEPVPGVLVTLFATPIWYANAVHFREEVSAAIAEAAPVRVFVLDHCERAGIAFGVARAGVHLHESLRRSGLAVRIGEHHFFPTVDEAVQAMMGEPPLRPTEREG